MAQRYRKNISPKSSLTYTVIKTRRTHCSQANIGNLWRFLLYGWKYMDYYRTFLDCTQVLSGKKHGKAGLQGTKVFDSFQRGSASG